MMTKGKIAYLFFLTSLVLTVFFVFKHLFLGDNIAWGDAPYYYSEALMDLIGKPSVWTGGFDNFFGGINSYIWIWPYMYLFAKTALVLGIASPWALRIFFYFPSLFLSFIFMYFIAKRLSNNRLIAFLSAFLYIFNTYYLLLIDGGTVGVALAYGLFPLLFYLFLKYFDNRTLVNFVSVFLGMEFMILIDPRVFAITFIFIALFFILNSIFVGKIFKKYDLLLFFILFIGLVGINFYWLYPIFKLGNVSLGSDVTNLGLISIINPLLFFQPHWFGNIYGKINYPVFYFLTIPLFVFLAWRFTKVKKMISLLLMLFLTACFFAKGSTPPFGIFYDFVINKIPFGSVLRDSSKFFIPCMFFGSILVAQGIYLSAKKIKVDYLNSLFIIFAFGFLIFIIKPAVLGKMNFVLSGRDSKLGFEKIASYLREDKDLSRVLWFPEKNPLSFDNKAKVGINGKNLSDFRPFSLFNVGSYDRFNYLNAPLVSELMGIMNIKYLAFPGDFRSSDLTEKEIINWNNFIKLSEENKDFKKVESTDEIPLFINNKIMPRIYAVDNLYLVVGSENFYEKLYEWEIPIANQLFLFVEDGIFGIDDFKSNDFNNTYIIFNNKNRIDLQMGFFTNEYLDLSKTTYSDWKVYSPGEYLNWRFELLIRGVKVDDFDYRRGIAFSSKSKEKIEYPLNNIDNGEYVIAIRGLAVDDNTKLKVTLNDKSYDIEENGSNLFGWNIIYDVKKESDSNLIIENVKGSYALNSIAVIRKEDFVKAEKETDNLITKYPTVEISRDSFFRNKSYDLPFEQIQKYSYQIPQQIEKKWIVLGEAFQPLWQLNGYGVSLPAYSMVNGFYVAKEDEVNITFKGQNYLLKGILLSKLSVIFVFVLLGGYLFYQNVIKNKKNNRD